MTSNKTLTAVAAASMLAISAGAAQAEGVRVGVLECKVSSGFGFVLGSSRDVDCVYLPAKGGNKQRYNGSIKKFGVDIGYVSEATIMWAVVAPNWEVPDGALAGDYVGGTASAALGVGAGPTRWSAAAASRSPCSRSASKARRASPSRPASAT